MSIPPKVMILNVSPFTINNINVTNFKVLTHIAFKMRKDWEALQLAFDIRGADRDERNEFAANNGVRWSALNELPGWLTYSSAPLDLMHNLYLGRQQLLDTEMHARN